MKIEISLNKKSAFIFLFLFAILSAIVYVFAYQSGGPPSVVGHSSEELEIKSRYLGTTDLSFNGNFQEGAQRGYGVGFNRCRDQYGVSAVMCSLADLGLSAWPVGIGPTGWYSSFLDAGNNSNDCLGWTTASPSYYGPSMPRPTGSPIRTRCDIVQPIHCCTRG